jgi:multiple sugar transport system substrate-binding protein
MNDWTTEVSTRDLSRRGFLAKAGAATLGAAVLGNMYRNGAEAAAVCGANSVMTGNARGQTITVWNWDPLPFNKVVDDYIQGCAGVSINCETFGSSSLPQKEAVAAAAGIGLPDAFKASTGDIPRLVGEGAVHDITSLVAPYKNLLPDVGWKEVMYQGKIWAIAANSPAGGMFYRYDVLSKYGLSPAKVQTWDDLISLGQQLSKASGGKASLLSGPSVGLEGYIIGTIQQQFRAQLIGSDLKVKIGPQSSAWLNTLALAKRMKSAPIYSQMDDWTQPWYQAIKSGSVAAFPSGTWFVETIIQQAPDSKHAWYFTPFPAVKAGGDRYPNFGSAICCISSQTQKVAAALEWAKAWTLDPYGTLTLGLKQLGISVISKAALTNAYVNAPHPYFAVNQAYWRDATEAFAKSAYVPPVTPYDSEANDIFTRHMNDWWNGKVSDQAVLSGIAGELRSKLKLS